MPNRRLITKLNESDIRQYYEQALRLEMPMLINFLVKEIVLYNDKIEIYFNTPIKTSPDDERRRGFLFIPIMATYITEYKTNRNCKTVK